METRTKSNSHTFGFLEKLRIIFKIDSQFVFYRKIVNTFKLITCSDSQFVHTIASYCIKLL